MLVLSFFNIICWTLLSSFYFNNMESKIINQLVDNNNNNTENDKEDILTTFRKIVASAQFINHSIQQQQQQPQINYLNNLKLNQLEMQKNNNYNFRQCKGREKRKFTSEVSDFLVEEVLKRKRLLVENNTSRDLTFSEKKRNAWNEVRSLLSTSFIGFNQNIEAIKSHWRYRKRKVTDAYGEFNGAPNLENKLKQKLSPIDKQIYEELKESNMLQSMEIDNKSISEKSDEISSPLNDFAMSASSSFNQNLNSPDKQNIYNSSIKLNCPTNNIQFILNQLIAKKYNGQHSPNLGYKHNSIENFQNINEKNSPIHVKPEEDLIEETEEINNEDEESIEILQRKALKAQILAFNEFRNSAKVVCNTAKEFQKLLPQLTAFLNKSLIE
ncbi:hypothetical protein Mgra_00004336 [Meloidogyne graminicola]|uniref:Regulatory protein zeste n=1 Tax=Meloidogyne graminicola TaxID=189291 RepID=A0A8S9ZRV9_9BILA|nr:hypothetical protein Mgra_00004336 [Meloidogyne graminicola]